MNKVKLGTAENPIKKTASDFYKYMVDILGTKTKVTEDIYISFSKHENKVETMPEGVYNLVREQISTFYKEVENHTKKKYADIYNEWLDICDNKGGVLPIPTTNTHTTPPPPTNDSTKVNTSQKNNNQPMEFLTLSDEKYAREVLLDVIEVVKFKVIREQMYNKLIDMLPQEHKNIARKICHAQKFKNAIGATNDFIAGKKKLADLTNKPKDLLKFVEYTLSHMTTSSNEQSLDTTVVQQSNADGQEKSAPSKVMGSFSTLADALFELEATSPEMAKSIRSILDRTMLNASQFSEKDFPTVEFVVNAHLKSKKTV